MLIVGLGNPGHQYRFTRHNLGFRVVESLVTTMGAADWRADDGTRWTKISEHWIVEPYEFMNASGESLRSFCEWHELPFEPSRLMIIHDDLDFPLGTVKLDHNRSAGGHRGIQSIIDVLHSQDFARLRLGIGSNREQGIPAEAYVLQKFSEQEEAAVNEMIAAAVKTVQRQIAL